MKKDWILILSVLLLSGVLWLVLYACQPPAGQALVTIDGAPFGTYDLKTDQRIILPHHTLVINAGAVRLTASDCMGQDCVKIGAIHKGGQAILCLPYRLNVQITASVVDTVTY